MDLRIRCNEEGGGAVPVFVHLRTSIVQRVYQLVAAGRACALAAQQSEQFLAKASSQSQQFGRSSYFHLIARYGSMITSHDT